MSSQDPVVAKEKMSELMQRQNLLFFKELKNKRIAKIKSKLYHKIKKKKE